MSHAKISGKRSAPSTDVQEAAWIADEDRFVLQQAKKKAVLRVKGGRAQPLDWLAAALTVIDAERNPVDDEVDLNEVDLKEPETLIESLNAQELVELEKGIESYISLEKSRTLKTICEDRRKQHESQPSVRGVSNVAADLDKLLGAKTLGELEKLEVHITDKLNRNESIDMDYWEHLLKSLLKYKAKAKLRDMNGVIVRSRLISLRKQQAEKGRKWKISLNSDSSNNLSSDLVNASLLDPEPMLRLQPEDRSLQALTEEEFAQHIAQERESTRKQGYIPSLKRAADPALEPASKRPRTIAGASSSTIYSTQQSAFDREVARGLAENEGIFTAEVPVVTKNLSQWKDKYRPRKPRYFNRVMMGYEWNKYNQTHYDHDNPPPKVVQGYKFNIFYPDLVDNTRAPTYRMEREDGRRRGEMTAPAGEDDTCIIRFVAGPPYEDVAFRIVDKEWDYSAKRERGFKSSFDKGVLQLHFQFKKIYYRK